MWNCPIQFWNKMFCFLLRPKTTFWFFSPMMKDGRKQYKKQPSATIIYCSHSSVYVTGTCVSTTNFQLLWLQVTWWFCYHDKLQININHCLTSCCNFFPLYTFQHKTLYKMRLYWRYIMENSRLNNLSRDLLNTHTEVHVLQQTRTHYRVIFVWFIVLYCWIADSLHTEKSDIDRIKQEKFLTLLWLPAKDFALKIQLQWPYPFC